VVRWWFDDAKAACPYDVGKDALFVCFDTAAALGCHLAAGWSLPEAVLDLRIEFKRRMSGRLAAWSDSLAGALLAHGLDAADAPCPGYSGRLGQVGALLAPARQQAPMDGCETGTQVLRELFLAMLPTLDIPRALYRGRYAAVLSRVEHAGVPLDLVGLQALQDNWLTIRERLIQQLDRSIDVFREGRFRDDLWQRWVAARGLPWPRHRDGRLNLGASAFRRMAQLCPEVERVRALKNLLDQLRHFELPVGADGRTRWAPGAFGTVTGRNAPRTSDCIFLWPAWCRGLIQAPPGRALAYLDFSQSEFLIAGALSGDERLIADYRAGGGLPGPDGRGLWVVGSSRIQCICWVNPNRRRALMPLWKALLWERIEREASRRGIVPQRMRYEITVKR
jgi:hypothetical protein